MDKAKEWQIGKVQFCNSKKKKKKSFINITRELEVIQGRMEATELRNKNISEPHWIVLPIFFNSTPGAHMDIALSRHSLVTWSIYSKKSFQLI